MPPCASLAGGSGLNKTLPGNWDQSIGAGMGVFTPAGETRVAVLVDCDNVSPEILEHALRVVAQFGRVVLRGNLQKPAVPIKI